MPSRRWRDLSSTSLVLPTQADLVASDRNPVTEYNLSEYSSIFFGSVKCHNDQLLYLYHLAMVKKICIT